MKRPISIAASLVFGVGVASTARAQIALRGSDTLENVTMNVISHCPAAVGVSYVGGGSAGGQAAMVAGTQQIAPMTRELNGAGCVAGASELLIGLDGVVVVSANQTGGDSVSPTPPNVCTDTISGGNRTMVVQFGGCSAGEISTGACTVDNSDPLNPVHRYTFKSWKDILAMVYGGQNNGTGARTMADKHRNPDKIDCGGNIRRTLVDSWGQIFTSSTLGTAACRTTTCIRLKHAFRRGDLSATTDAFVGLVGLQAIPPFTTVALNFVEAPDSAATVNPFCNAGEKLMNKGFSDHMDMDPIRRIADSAFAGGAPPGNRQGKEQVAQGYWQPANPPLPLGSPDQREIDDPAAAPNLLKPLVALPDASHAQAQNWSFDPNTSGSAGLQKASFLSPGPTVGITGNARQGLGVVLVIEIPTNYDSTTRTYWDAPANAPPILSPVACTPTKFAAKIMCTTCVNIMCPDGFTTGTGTSVLCNLPVQVPPYPGPGTLANPNFNCLSDRAASPPFPPGPLALKDPRVFNLLVLDQSGVAVRDKYFNPNAKLPNGTVLSATRQGRLVSAFFRLHASEVTPFGGAPTIAGNPNLGIPSTVNVCNRFTSTDQIGCLVRASPCSLGYAGREANDTGDFAAQVENIQASAQNIKNFAAGVSPIYPIARGLWVSSFKGFGNVTDVIGPPSDNELSLLTCFGGGPGAGGPNDPRNPTSPVHTALSAFGFVPIDVGDVILPALTDCATAP